MPLGREPLYSRNIRALLAVPRAGGRARARLGRRDHAWRCVTARRRRRRRDGRLFVFELTMFVLAVFLGFEVISKVPTILHTPLMSGTNAIHGIVIVGAMLISARRTTRSRGRSAFIAVVLGDREHRRRLVVTDRMLDMFKRSPTPGAMSRRSDLQPNVIEPPLPRRDRRLHRRDRASSPRRRARARGTSSAAGMLIAIALTFAHRRRSRLGLIVAGDAVGAVIGRLGTAG